MVEEHARAIGRLLARTSTTDIVDASVVVLAQEHGKDVLTSDPDDLNPLAGALGRPMVNVRSITNLLR